MREIGEDLEEGVLEGIVADLAAELAEAALGADDVLDVGLLEPEEELDLVEAAVGGGDDHVGIGEEEGGEEVEVGGGKEG